MLEAELFFYSMTKLLSQKKEREKRKEERDE